DLAALAAVLELVAGPGGEQDLVADLQLHRGAGPVVLELAGADGEHLAPLRLVLGGVRQQDAAAGLLLGGLPADDDPVTDRLEPHRGLRRCVETGNGRNTDSECRRAEQVPCPSRSPDGRLISAAACGVALGLDDGRTLPRLRGGARLRLSLWQRACPADGKRG